MHRLFNRLASKASASEWPWLTMLYVEGLIDARTKLDVVFDSLKLILPNHTDES